jgi:hypothetical protein
MVLVVLSLKIDGEVCCLCCEKKYYLKHKNNVFHIDHILKGVSDNKDESIEDFCVNYFLFFGEFLEVDSYDIEFINVSIH